MGKYVANKLGEGYTNDPNNETVRLLPAVSDQDVVAFYQQHIANNQNRVWIVIGDKKLTDMKALSRFGKVVELKREEVYR